MEFNGMDAEDTAPPVAIKVAEYAGTVSGYVQSRTVEDMLDDANRLIRTFPEHSLMAAAAAGLLLGFAIRRK